MQFFKRWNGKNQVVVGEGYTYFLSVDDMITATSKDFNYIESLVPTYSTRGVVRITSIPPTAKIYRRMA